MAYVDFHPSHHWYFSDLSHTTQFHSQGLLLILIIFSIIILIIFLFFKLAFFFGHFSTNTSSSTSHSMETSPAPPSGLDAATIKSIPLYLHTTSLSCDDSRNIFRENECSICLRLFQDDEMVKVLPECLHAYHPDCVDKWLSGRSSCPLCRSSLDSSTGLVTLTV